MAAVPRLADVQCSRMQFEPGDRLLVRTNYPLDRASAAKLQKTVERWAGNHVEVLVIPPGIDIQVEKRSSKIIT